MVAEEGPEIYLLDGDDEFAIQSTIDKLSQRLGDATIAGMNTTRLDGKSLQLAQLKDAIATVPFLASKRLVILTQPTARLKTKAEQEAFIAFLESDMPTSKLVLAENSFLTREKDRKENHLHWLEKWATAPQQSKRVFVRHFPQPSGGLMVRWIQDQVKSLGGQFTSGAAVALSNQVGNDTRLAAQEITKLLTYVNYARPVDEDDVQHLTPLTARIGDFDLVNALRNRDQRKAQALLQRSLQDDEPRNIFYAIVNQVRVLLMAREILEERLTANDFPESLKISYYPAKLALEAAPHFTTPFLEMIYHRLLEMDVAIKSSQIDDDLALELLVAELTH